MRPMPAPRPRAARGKTGKPYVHMPPEYKKRSELIRKELLAAGVRNPKDGVFFLEIEHIFVPGRLTKSEREIVQVFPFRESTPDLDNMDKTIMDALNSYVWQDDALLVGSMSVKLYGAEEGTQINVYRAERQQPWHTGFKPDS